MLRAPLQVLRADGMRIDLSRRDAGALLVATRQGWQQTAFGYRDMIGELRYAVRLRAQSVARVRYYIAETRPWPEDPIPLEIDEDDKDAVKPSLDAQLVADAIHNFNLIPIDDRPDGFTARLDENLDIAGECWLHIDADGRFHVRSVSEVSATADGRVTISTLPTATAGSMRVLDPNTESLLRLWAPHPEYGQLADSSLRTLQDVCEDIVLAGREQRAAARSRVAANGLLLLPASLSLAQERTEDDGDGVAEDTFMSDFTAAMLAPIRDDGDSQAVVPIVIRGEIEDLEKVRHVTLQRADPEQLIARQSAALLRLLRGMDVQPEQVDGLGSTNHWTSWQIDARAIRDQVKPAAETIAACLMQAYMIPALEDLGYTRDQLDNLTIAVDTSPLSENPNRGQDARDAHTAMVIRDAALREALGFDEDDAPDEEEMVRRLATSGKLPVDAVAQIFGLRGGPEQAQPITIDAQPSERAALPAAEERPQAVEGEVTPTNPIPAEPTQIVAAAPVPDPFGFVVDVAATRRLADIDAELADRITVAADAALARILEKAGARVKSKAQKDSTLAASLVGVDALAVPARLGREKVAEFASIQDLIGDGYGRLRGQFGKWMSRAAEQVAEVVVDVLHLDRRSDRADAVRDQVRSRLEVRTGQAWQTLTEHLDAAAEEALFRDDPLTPDPGPGEPVDTLIRPADVEDVLRVAGGGQSLRQSSQTRTPMRSETPGPGGYGSGPDVTGLLQEQGAVLLGWEWQYRNAIHRDHKFAPWHTQLNGLRFSTFTDPQLDTDPETAWLGPYYFPGDHAGCRCRVIPLLAVPELDDGIVAQRLREAAGDPRNVLAERVAAEDAAAGRVGTSLQQEVEVRSRITEAVERLTREHIGGSR